MSETYREFSLNEYEESPWFTRENVLVKEFIDYILNGRVRITEVTDSDYYVTPEDRYIRCATGSTIYLPAAAGTGNRVTIKNTHNEYNLTIDGNGGLIDGSSTLTIYPYQAYTLVDVDTDTWDVYSYYTFYSPPE